MSISRKLKLFCLTERIVCRARRPEAVRLGEREDHSIVKFEDGRDMDACLWCYFNRPRVYIL